MKDTINISVIIPAFNCAKTISRALESVYCQTYKPYEVLVINDGSTDSTFDVLKDHQDQITILDKLNGGAASARNLGIKNASGEYVAFLDADDRWNPRHLEYAARFFSKHAQIEWYTGSVKKVTSKGTLIQRLPERSSGSIQPHLRKFLHEAFVGDSFLVSTIAVVIRTSVVKELNGFCESLTTGEDRELWFRIGLKHPLIGYDTEDVNEYILQQGSLSSEKNNRFERRLLTIDQMRKNVGADHVGGVECFLKNEYDRCFRIGIRDGKFKELNALKNIWRAWPWGLKRNVLIIAICMNNAKMANSSFNKLLAKVYGY